MYKQIEMLPKYEINESGHVRNIRSKKDKYLTPTKSGYLHLLARVDKKLHCFKIHRLVAELFLPPPDPDLVTLCKSKYPYVVCVNHIDHNKLNNHVSNLEWCDINYNNQAAIKAGVVPPLKGELNGRAILTEELVHKICSDFEKGVMPLAAVEKYHISKQQATKIRAGFAWKHISSLYNIVVNKRRKIND